MKTPYSKLDTACPLCFAENGLRLCFSKNLTKQEVRWVFNQMTAFDVIETPNGMLNRKRAIPGDCLANRVKDAIKRECAHFPGNLPRLMVELHEWDTVSSISRVEVNSKEPQLLGSVLQACKDHFGAAAVKAELKKIGL